MSDDTTGGRLARTEARAAQLLAELPERQRSASASLAFGSARASSPRSQCLARGGRTVVRYRSHLRSDREHVGDVTEHDSCEQQAHAEPHPTAVAGELALEKLPQRRTLGRGPGADLLHELLLHLH